MNQDDVVRRLEDPEIVSRKFADRVAEKFDRIGTTPNRLTMWRVVLSLPMALCFILSSAYSHVFLYWLFWLSSGALLYIWCALCDFFDGALARYQKRVYNIAELTEDEEYALSFWERLNLRGTSHFGTVLDPFSDKTLYFGAVFPLGWYVVDRSYLWLSLLIALILTLIRFRAIRRALEFGGKGAANKFGKYKIIIEVCAVASLALLPSGPFKVMLANITIGTALVIGGLSLVGHTWLGIRKAKTAALQKLVASKRRRSSSSNLPVSK